MGGKAARWRERVLLLQAWLLLLAVDLALRIFPFRRVYEAAGRVRPAAIAAEAGTEAARLARLVNGAATLHLLPMGCLRRALALQWLLGRRGIPATLRFGVQREGKALQAHAWLEVEGRPVAEPRDIESRFAPLLNAKE